MSEGEKEGKEHGDVGKVDKTKARAARSPAFYYSGGISDVNDDGGGVDDSNADEDHSDSISAVHFMTRIVTHAREPRGGTNVHCTTCETSTSSCFLRSAAATMLAPSFHFVPFLYPCFVSSPS